VKSMMMAGVCTEYTSSMMQLLTHMNQIHPLSSASDSLAFESSLQVAVQEESSVSSIHDSVDEQLLEDLDCYPQECNSMMFENMLNIEPSSPNGLQSLLTHNDDDLFNFQQHMFGDDDFPSAQIHQEATNKRCREQEEDDQVGLKRQKLECIKDEPISPNLPSDQYLLGALAGMGDEHQQILINTAFVDQTSGQRYQVMNLEQYMQLAPFFKSMNGDEAPVVNYVNISEECQQDSILEERQASTTKPLSPICTVKVEPRSDACSTASTPDHDDLESPIETPTTQSKSKPRRRKKEFDENGNPIKFLVCRGGIKRKNKKREPGDEYQMKFKLRA